MGGIDSRKLANWYDFQASFYSLWRDRWGSSLVDHVHRAFPATPAGGRLLDVGCGSGCFAVGLAERRPEWSVAGLDASRGMLDVAERRVRRLGLRNTCFRLGDATALPYDSEHFDAVVAGSLLPNVNDPGAVFREVHRVLKSTGQFVVVEFDRESMTRLSRGFFNIMILGYRAVSSIVPRFRFADGWTIERSTVDRIALNDGLSGAGFRKESEERVGGFIVLRWKRSAT